MFTYCRNNPVSRIDASGTVDYDCYDNDPLDQEDLLKTGEGGGSGYVAGIRSSYYAMQNVRAYDRVWRNSSYNTNLQGLKPVTQIGGQGDVSAQLQICANTANDKVTGKGSVAGTYKHNAFSAEVNKLGNSNLRTEVSYLNGKEVTYGTKRSIRFDVMLFNGKTPIAAWDFKTGAAILTKPRISQMLERSKLYIPIYMIK